MLKGDALIEQLRQVARWLENEAAHRRDPDEYRQIRRLAATCRRAVARLEARRR